MRDGKHVVLCIDDDQDVLDTLRLMLESEGCAVLEAPTAKEGIAVFESGKPDLILVDLIMENVGAGLDFVAKVKANHDPVPLYMLSNVGDELTRHTDSRGLGVDGVLQKPLRRETLREILSINFGKEPRP